VSDERIPSARVVKGGESVGVDTEKTWKPSTPAELDDEHPNMVAGHLRALQREVRDGFDSIGRALVALTRIEERLDVVIDRQNHQDQRLDALEQRVALLETKGRKAKKAK
jgi:hypothetical protein